MFLSHLKNISVKIFISYCINGLILNGSNKIDEFQILDSNQRNNC